MVKERSNRRARASVDELAIICCGCEIEAYRADASHVCLSVCMCMCSCELHVVAELPVALAPPLSFSHSFFCIHPSLPPTVPPFPHPLSFTPPIHPFPLPSPPSRPILLYLFIMRSPALSPKRRLPVQSMQSRSNKG